MSIGKNTVVGLTTDVILFGLGFLVSIVLTRSLGPEQRGVYAVLVTTNILVANVVHLSVGYACGNLLARGRYRLGEINTLALILAIGLGTAGILAVTALFPLLSDNVFLGVPYDYLLVALLLVPLTIYQIYWSAMMVGLNRLLLLNKLNLAVNLANAVAMIVVVGVLRLGIPGFLAVWAASALAGAAGNVILAARTEPFAWPSGRAALRDMLSFGLRTHGANIAHALFLRFDTYAVTTVVGLTSLGFYSVAISLAEKLWLPVNAIYAASLSKIAQLPRAESALLTAKVMRAAFLIMISIALPFAVVSPWLIPAMYGEEFRASVLPLVILLVGTTGFAVMLVVNNYILGQMQRPGLLSIISWLELGVSIPLYLALTLWQGIVGAAIASTLTYLIAMTATLYVFVRDSGLPLSQVLVPRRADFADYARVVQRILR